MGAPVEQLPSGITFLPPTPLSPVGGPSPLKLATPDRKKPFALQWQHAMTTIRHQWKLALAQFKDVLALLKTNANELVPDNQA